MRLVQCIQLLCLPAGMLRRRQLLGSQLEALPCKQMERVTTRAQVQSRPTMTHGSSQRHARRCCRTVVASSWLRLQSLVLSSWLQRSHLSLPPQVQSSLL